MKGKDLSLHDPDKENCSLKRKNYLILKWLPSTPVMSSHGWRFSYHFETEKNICIKICTDNQDNEIISEVFNG